MTSITGRDHLTAPQAIAASLCGLAALLLFNSFEARGQAIARPGTPPLSATAPFLPQPQPPSQTGTSAAALSAPLPDPLPMISEMAPEATTSHTHPAVDSALVPGQTIVPIDLSAALKLAGARNIDIAVARERVNEAVAELDLAWTYWLPSIFYGPNWIRHDGQAQDIDGKVRTINKSSLFMGATTALGNSVTGPIPGGGPAPLGNMNTILRISDAIFEPLAARQIVESRRAGVVAAQNDVLLEVSEAYLDLQRAAGRLMVAREAAAHAQTLSDLTSAYARSGAGLEADYRRSLTELENRRREIAANVGDLEYASASLIRLIRLDPRIVVAPVEPPEARLRLIDSNCSLDDLVVTGLRNRPELSEAQAIVEATLLRLKQARLRPFVPSLALRYSAGGFGGGTNSYFGAFEGRQDADVNLFWELKGLGLADRAIARQKAAQQRIASLEMVKLQDRVAMEVVQAEKVRIAADRQVLEAAAAVPEAISSLNLNLSSIRQGAGLPGAVRPIEVLQPIHALADARYEYLDAVLTENRAQFRLYHALGRPINIVSQSTISPQPPLHNAIAPALVNPR